MTARPTLSAPSRLWDAVRGVRRCRLAVATLATLAALAAGSAGAATVEVTTAALTFTPASVTIDVGDSVHFTGLLFHNVAESDCPSTVASLYNGGFRSGSTSAVLEWTHVFDEPGTFCYICEPHINQLMVGSVVVQAAVPSLSGEAGILAVALLALVGLGLLYREKQLT